MPAEKRITATKKSHLAARASPYSSSVTLFELEAESSKTERGLRRSKRVKTGHVPIVDLEDTVESLSDANFESDGEKKVGSTSRRKAAVTPTKNPKSSSAPRSPRKDKPVRQSLDVPHSAPPDWQETYDLIKQMRSGKDAPVDTMGCDLAHLKETEPRSQRLATLISLILSSQTKDAVVDAAVTSLQRAIGGTLTIDAILDADDGTISHAISKVGFWNKKTLFIKRSAEILRDKFDSDVPKTIEELVQLPGVREKVGFLVLQSAWHITAGIGVDTHVHRITNRLGWHKPPTKTEDMTRLNLQSWLPQELWHDINHMLVGFGQTICQPVSPRCDLCRLKTAGLCPSAQDVRNVEKRKVHVQKTTAAPTGARIEVELEEIAVTKVG